MKNKIQLKIPIIWLSVLVYLMPALGGAVGYVLCFGADGHIKVETTAPTSFNCAHSSKTTPKSVSYEHLMMGDAFSNDKDSSCVDIPILNDILNQNISTVQGIKLIIKLILIVPFPFFSPKFSKIVVNGFSISQLTDSNYPLAFIRTVILLI